MSWLPRKIACRWFIFVALVAIGPRLSSTPPTVEDFFRSPAISNPQISPDGRIVSFLTPGKGNLYDLNAYDIGAKKSDHFNLGADEVYRYSWIDADRLLLTLYRQTTAEVGLNMVTAWYRHVVFDIRKRKLTTNVSYIDQEFSLISQLRKRPDFFYVYFSGRDNGNTGLALINSKIQPAVVTSMSQKRFNVAKWVDLPNGEFHRAVSDTNGELRLLLLYVNSQLQYYYRSNENSPWAVFPFDPSKNQVISIDPNRDMLYLVCPEADGTTDALFRYDVRNGQLAGKVLTDPDYSLADCRAFRVSGEADIAGIVYARDRTEQVWFDPVFKNVQRILQAKFPGRMNLIIDCDTTKNTFVVSTASDRHPGFFLIYDRSTDKFSMLPDSMPWIKENEMRPMQVVHYQARDGLKLQGYLTLPVPAPDGAKPPLVVMPHGGPWIRDVWGFDVVAQFLASRGYAVFQPNYRGSSGFSAPVSLAEAAQFDFRAMHNDVTDGVHMLIEHQVVDPRRVAIFGASFGGYLALCGVAFEPGLYRCAVSCAGVFDWKLMLSQRWLNDKDTFNYDSLKSHLGDPKKNAARFEEISPIDHVSSINVPVFIYHGKEDKVVDVSQSKRLLDALEKHHVAVENLFFDEERHSMFEYENKVAFFTALERFLAKNLTPLP